MNEKKLQTVMVNNSTKINKTNNYLSPQIIVKNIMTLSMELQVLDWDRHKNVAGLKQIMGGISPPYLDKSKIVFKIGKTYVSVMYTLLFLLHCILLSLLQCYY